MWTGLGPNIFRNGVMNAAELATYDQSKQIIVGGGYMKDGTLSYIAASTITGFVTAFIGSPVDVTKTRIMNAKPGTYSGVGDCIIKTIKNDGPLAFYNGFTTNASRIISWNVVGFVTLQELRNLVSSSHKSK